VAPGDRYLGRVERQWKDGGVSGMEELIE